jgi:hypothetical protein
MPPIYILDIGQKSLSDLFTSEMRVHVSAFYFTGVNICLCSPMRFKRNENSAV